MLYIKKIVVGDGERTLLYRDRRFKRVLTPGVYRFFDPCYRITFNTCNLTRQEYAGQDADILMARMDDGLSEHFTAADIGSNEVGLVSKNGNLDSVLAPGSRQLYWKTPMRIDIQKISLADDLEIDTTIVKRLRQLNLLSRIAVTVDIASESVGLLFIDNRLSRVLTPGIYAFWDFQKNVNAEVIELRVQPMEVSGQELLTRDKVSLRVNLTASLRVIDPVAARTKVTKYGDFVYRELQYGLRKAVSAKTLDELLGDKASLDTDIFAYVQGRVRELGIEVLGVGIKDVILPGDMRDILNSVVHAEKAAQANVIRRREEANATRSLLNTAKIIEDSPILMRLKELEALEKVTEKIDKLTVFGGLEGVLKQLVTIKQ
ncbi:MAG: slipin family protein [Xanthomonadaceae bacterium]|nr:slipin family protein [Xanthomonadaceae bacterium]